jgi:hypothetical protein
MEQPTTNEKIRISQEDVWTCVCLNDALNYGFYPCDETGREVEPTPEAWTTRLYICAKCERLIDGATGEVKGRGHYIEDTGLLQGNEEPAQP